MTYCQRSGKIEGTETTSSCAATISKAFAEAKPTVTDTSSHRDRERVGG